MSRLVGPHIRIAERLLGLIEREMATERPGDIASGLGICKDHILTTLRQRRAPAEVSEEKSDHVSNSLHS